jgi:LPS-assembly protein
VKGLPVLYAPVFFHPDPSAERASGFLVPDVNISGRRGFSYEQPYYHVISPSQDVTISPQLNSKVNPFLFVDYRKRFYSGQLSARLGYTYENDFDNDGDKAGDPAFDIHAATCPSRRTRPIAASSSPTGNSSSARTGPYGFTAERTSDRVLFDKYDVGDVYEERGLFATDDRRLISQLYLIGSGERSYLTVSAMTFQGLRFGDDDAAFPIVAPLVEARYEPEQQFAGGRLRFRGSGVALFRQGPVAPIPAPAGTFYQADLARVEELDSSRVTLEADWRRIVTFASGLRVEPLALLRGDRLSRRRPAAGTVEGARSR